MASQEGRWIEQFKGLAALSPELKQLLIQGSKVIEVPAGTQIFRPGLSADNFLLLLEGTVRVQQTSETGRDVVLYRIHAGESCVMTTACMLAFKDYAADGLAETDVRAVAILKSAFDDLISQSSEFREFVFKAYSRRILDLFALVDDLAFRRLDVRLASRLIELSDRNDTVHATHQALSNEMATAREVISRTLSEFNRRGWIEQSRGEVRLVDRKSLERLAQSEH